MESSAVSQRPWQQQNPERLKRMQMKAEVNLMAALAAHILQATCDANFVAAADCGLVLHNDFSRHAQKLQMSLLFFSCAFLQVR